MPAEAKGAPPAAGGGSAAAGGPAEPPGASSPGSSGASLGGSSGSGATPESSVSNVGSAGPPSPTAPTADRWESAEVAVWGLFRQRLCARCPVGLDVRCFLHVDPAWDRRGEAGTETGQAKTMTAINAGTQWRRSLWPGLVFIGTPAVHRPHLARHAQWSRSRHHPLEADGRRFDD